MAPDTRIVAYTPEHRSEVVRFQRALWTRNAKLNARYFEWKYERNPSLDDPLVMLCFHRNRIVGMRAMFGACWTVGVPPQTVAIPCASDSLIDLEFRNRGLIQELNDAALEELARRGYAYVFNLSASPVTVLNSLTHGWRRAGGIERMHRSTRVGQLMRAGARRRFPRRVLRLGRLVRHRFPGLDPYSTLDRTARAQRAITAYIASSDAPRPGPMAELVDRAPRDGRIRRAGGERYFAWRFENPFARYRFLYWEEDGKLEGFLVLRTSPWTAMVDCHVADWEAARPDVLAGLFQAAVEWGGFDDLELWSGTQPSETRSMLERLGFRAHDEAPDIREYRPAVLLRGLETADPTRWQLAGRSLDDLASWDLRMLDSDGI